MGDTGQDGRGLGVLSEFYLDTAPGSQVTPPSAPSPDLPRSRPSSPSSPCHPDPHPGNPRHCQEPGQGPLCLLSPRPLSPTGSLAQWTVSPLPSPAPVA